MTIDQDNERVSATYRDIATESTPPGLDRRVLDAAKREARPRYGLVRAWIRPLAWAATVGLSLAFLLEMTWFTEPPPAPEPIPRAAPARQPEPATPPAALEERARRDADVMKAKQESDLRKAAPQRAGVPEASSLRAAGEGLEAVRHCDDEARETAASWYACIEALRDGGRGEDAAAELEALLRAFPDYEMPATE